MRSGLAFFVGLLALGAEALPQTFDLEKALELPPSPGAIALLVEHTRDERARKKLTEALKDPRADVRAAAVRVVHAASVEALISNVTEALASESGPSTGMEMVMAVAGYADSEGVVLQATRKLDIASVTARALAAGAGLRALDHLDALREIDPKLAMASFLRIASRGDLAALGPLAARALREPNSGLWKAYLEAARESEENVGAGLLSVGLTLKELRPATLWHVLLSGVEVDVPPEATSETEELFLMELLARRDGQKPRESKAWIAARAAREETPFSEIREPRSNHVLLLLTKNERRALSSQVRRDPKSLDGWYERAKETDREIETAVGPTPTTPTLKTVSDFPTGFVASVLEVTDCEPKTLIGIGSAEVEFSLVGRPVRVRFNPYPVEPEGCSVASRALILNSIVPSHALSAKANWDSLLVLLEPDFLACLSEVRTPSSFKAPEGVRLGGEIQPPRKIKDFAPVYPESARASRISGTVILDAIITSSGCVRGIRTLQSPDNRLALASIVAVSRWRYEPTRLAGEPVPIVMTIRINFALD